MSPKQCSETSTDYLSTLERTDRSLMSFFKDADNTLIEELERLCNSISEIKKKRIGTDDEKREEMRVYIMLVSLAGLLNLDKLADLDVNSKNSAKSEKRSRQNFPKQAQKVLEEWVRTHPSAAECTKESKEELAQKTGLSVKQVSMWLVNRRRRSPPLLLKRSCGGDSG